MKVFFDSSAFAKRFIHEKGSQEIYNICQKASETGLSVICYPEIFSALNRRLMENSISQNDYILAKQSLSEELPDVRVINITPTVVGESVFILETTSILRAMDALHIACAVEWGADLFVTADQRQAKAAQSVKLKVKCLCN